MTILSFPVAAVYDRRIYLPSSRSQVALGNVPCSREIPFRADRVARTTRCPGGPANAGPQEVAGKLPLSNPVILEVPVAAVYDRPIYLPSSSAVT